MILTEQREFADKMKAKNAARGRDWSQINDTERNLPLFKVAADDEGTQAVNMPGRILNDAQTREMQKKIRSGVDDQWELKYGGKRDPDGLWPEGVDVIYHENVYVKYIPVLRGNEHDNVANCKQAMLNIIIDNRIYRDGELDILFHEFRKRCSAGMEVAVEEVISYCKNWLND